MPLFNRLDGLTPAKALGTFTAAFAQIVSGTPVSVTQKIVGGTAKDICFANIIVTPDNNIVISSASIVDGVLTVFLANTKAATVTAANITIGYMTVAAA